MAQPRTAVAKGSIVLITERGAIALPAFVYKADDTIELFKTHMRHSSCMGRIRYKYHCETCGVDVSRDDISKVVEYDGEPTPLTRDDLDETLERERGDIIIKGTVPVDEVLGMFASGYLSWDTRYFVAPFRIKKSRGYEVMPASEQQLRLLYDGLAKNRQALYVEVPFASRYGYLFASGDLVTVKFAQEMRERPPMLYGPGEGYKRGDLTVMSKFLKSIAISPEVPDIEPIASKVDSFIEQAVKAQKITARKRGAKREASVEELMAALKEVAKA